MRLLYTLKAFTQLCRPDRDITTKSNVVPKNPKRLLKIFNNYIFRINAVFYLQTIIVDCKLVQIFPYSFLNPFNVY